MPRVGLVTALLPPSIGGTQILVWRLFRDDPNLVVVSGVKQSPASRDQAYSPLAAPTLWLPYPRLRGYRFGLAPALGAYSAAWLAAALVRVVRYFKLQGVDHIVSIPHQGPFALLGLLAAHRLGIPHTLYILDAWEEGSTGPIEHALVRWGLRFAARMPQSRVAVVSPALGDHYRRTFGFRDVTWIPNPAPLPEERFPVPASTEPIVVFTGGIKPFNLETIRRVARSIRRCKVVKRLIITGEAQHFGGSGADDDLHDRVEFRLCSRAELAALQGQAAVLLVATNADDASPTSLGYLPGRLPEYVLARRPILLIGPQRSEAARAVRHWSLGPTTTSQDEQELAELLDALATQAMEGTPAAASATHDIFLELFSRREARHRLLGEPAAPLSQAADERGAAFESAPRG